MFKVIVYSLPSCIASNDFIIYCKSKVSDLETYVVKDSSWPQIRYDITIDSIESKYNRKFFTYPIIYINNQYVNSIQEAKKIITKGL